MTSRPVVWEKHGKTIVKSQVSRGFEDLILCDCPLFLCRVSKPGGGSTWWQFNTKQPLGDEEEAASIPLQLMMQGIFDAILMRTSPRMGRWWGRWFQLHVLIGQRDWFGDCGWIRIVSFCGWIQSSISTCWWIQSVARTSVDFLKRGKLHAKDTSNVGECNSHSAVTKVWCWKLMCLVVGKNYAKRFVNLWIASWRILTLEMEMGHPGWTF